MIENIKNFVNEWLQAPEAIQSRQLPDQITMPIPMAGIQANKETQNTKNATIQTQNTKGIAIKAPPELIPTPIAAPMSPRVAKPPAPVLSLTCCYQTIITLISHCNHTVIILLSYCNHTVMQFFVTVVSKFVLIVQTGTQLFAKHWDMKSWSPVLFSYLWTHTQ